MKKQTKTGNAYIKEESRGSFLGSTVLAFLSALCVAVVFILLFSVLFYTKPELLPYAGITGCICGALSALLCGIFAGRRKRHAGALAGFLAGLLYLICLAIVGTFFHSAVSLPKKLVGYAIFLLLAVLGGTLGAFRTRQRHRARRRR